MPIATSAPSLVGTRTDYIPRRDRRLGRGSHLAGTAIAQSLHSQERARSVWADADPVEGTPVETYLVTLGLGFSVPGGIRHGVVPRCWDALGREALREPAMIAAAHDVAGRVCGIERTFLSTEGRKARPGEPPQTLGNVRGATLRLGPPTEEIMLTTCTEEALALRLLHPGATVWSTFGPFNLLSVELPDCVRRVVLCGTADMRSYATMTLAGEVLREKGVEVRMLFPSDGAATFNEEWVRLHA